MFQWRITASFLADFQLNNHVTEIFSWIILKVGGAWGLVQRITQMVQTWWRSREQGPRINGFKKYNWKCFHLWNKFHSALFHQNFSFPSSLVLGSRPHPRPCWVTVARLQPGCATSLRSPSYTETWRPETFWWLRMEYARYASSPSVPRSQAFPPPVFDHLQYANMEGEGLGERVTCVPSGRREGMPPLKCPLKIKKCIPSLFLWQQALCPPGNILVAEVTYGVFLSCVYTAQTVLFLWSCKERNPLHTPFLIWCDLMSQQPNFSKAASLKQCKDGHSVWNGLTAGLSFLSLPYLFSSFLFPFFPHR